MINWLENWYAGNCNGDWEHSYGIKIETSDNPGWIVDIDLTNTVMDRKVFDPFKRERDNCNWIHCSIKDNVFRGRCGSRNLEELLIVFKEWVEVESTV
jgi:hypothetical protein